MVERLYEYGRKLRILRQIQSNKASHFANINRWEKIATVVVSSLLTFIGFSGTERVQTYVGWIVAADKLKVEFAFNLLVFVLFVLLILHLVFRFDERQAESERAVVAITGLINALDDILTKAQHQTVGATEVDLVRARYEMLTQAIPPNTDREYLNARKDYQAKQAKAAGVNLTAQDIFEPKAQAQAVETIVRQSELLMTILRALRAVDDRLYLAGGSVRNAVWDYLHGYKPATPVDDVDVFYFDNLSVTKQHDEALEAKLKAQIQNLKWSVKNQARMHVVSGEQPYSSIDDAMIKAPETATAIALRLKGDDQFEFVAPHGFGDLFRLVVAPTPHFMGKLDRYKQRVQAKNWISTWPRLRVLLG